MLIALPTASKHLRTSLVQRCQTLSSISSRSCPDALLYTTEPVTQDAISAFFSRARRSSASGSCAASSSSVLCLLCKSAVPHSSSRRHVSSQASPG